MNNLYISHPKILQIFIISIVLINFNCTSVYELFPNKGELEFKNLLESGKKSFYDKDYESSIYHLEKAILIKPNNQESHYFLGYAYDKLNSEDGNYLLGVSRVLTLKSSNHFEKVIDISPEYKGEQVILDPYSKLTGLWASLAMAYISKGQIDSANWAFQKGNSAGGFYPSLMEFNRDVMATCDKDAILFTNGDNDTFPMWYLQQIEEYRPDITVVNLSLLNTAWYIKQLKNSYPFGSNNINILWSNTYIDSLSPVNFSARTMWVDVPNSKGGMTWSMEPTIDGKFLRIQDLILYKIIIDNSWQRPIYFSCTVPQLNWIGLDNHLRIDGLAYCLAPFEGYVIPKEKLEMLLFNVYKYQHINDDHNKYIKGMSGLYRHYRACMIMLANKYLVLDDKLKARELIEYMQMKIPENIIPFNDIRQKEFVEKFHSQL